MRFANNEKIYVATYKEIIIGFLTFTLILFVLYPKKIIMEQILQEKSNYDLSVLYLKNMLKNDPNNEQLILMLAQKSINSQKRDLAIHLLELLKKSPHKKVQEQAYLLSYKLLKQNYFYLQKKKDLKATQKLQKELATLLLTIVNKHFYTRKEITMLYKEAMFLHSKKAQYALLAQQLKANPNNLKILSDTYYLAVAMKKYKDALHYLDNLSAIDVKNTKKYKDAQYFLLTKIYNNKELEDYLLQKAKKSHYWQKRLIYFYLKEKKYKKAAAYYMHLFSKSSHFFVKREFWMEAIDTLRAGRYTKEAIHLASKYERYFFKDEKSRIYLLKLYIALGELQKAQALSKKILELWE